MNKLATICAVAGLVLASVSPTLHAQPTTSIVIQPTSTESNDASVCSDGRYWDELAVFGHCSSNVYRSYQQYDLSSIPAGATIVSADYNVNLYAWCTNSSMDMAAYRLTESFDEATIRWSNQPATDLTVAYGSRLAGTPATSPPGYNAWDITDLVQFWMDNPSDNFGFVLRAVNESLSLGAVAGYNAEYSPVNLPPFLDVTYILNSPPSASANGPYLVAIGETIFLDSSGSYDPDGDSLVEEWIHAEGYGLVTGVEFTGLTPGVGTLTLTVTDPGGLTDSDTAIVVVYDPSAGFVTGGGWINSPEGALTLGPLLTGKANFGFVSKYKKGAKVPTGNTEFQFHAGGLNFHSSNYDWLVVTGSDYARFKGTGTIMDVPGDFKFMLWAGDDATDTFRIRIWEEDEASGVETDVYDNGSDQAIGGGSIVIHTK